VVDKPASLTDLKNSLVSYYAGMTERMRRVPDLLDHKYRGMPILPEGVVIHETSTAPTIIDNLVDQVRTDAPTVQFTPRGKTQKDGANKELMELWGHHILRSLDSHSFITPETQLVRDALTRDAACIKFLVDEDALAEAPVRDDFPTQNAFTKALRKWRADAADTWPFMVRPVDPLRIYPAPGNKRPPDFVVEVQTRVVFDIIQKYGDIWARAGKSAKTFMDWMSKTEWIEYWSADHFIVEVDRIQIIDVVNPYGILPYAFGYTGRGRLNWDGDPTQLVHPMLLDYTGEMEAEARLKTALDAAWQFYVFPRLLTDDDPRKVARALQKGPGAVIKVADMANRPQWLDSPEPSIAALTFLQLIMAAIDKRFPAGLMNRPAGVEAALHQATLIGQALKPLVPVRGLLNRLMSEVLNGLSHMMAVLDLPMNVFGTVGKTTKDRTVKGSDFTHRNFEVKYEATDPSEDDRRILTGLGLLREKSAQGIPVISRRTFREVYAPRVMPNSEEEEEQVLVEAVVDQILAGGVLMQVVMEMLGALQQEAQEEQTAQGLQGQITGAAGKAIPEARARGLESITGQPQRGPREQAQPAQESAGV
jgi:hypothetical protein